MGYKTNIRVVLKNLNKDNIGMIFLEISFHDEITKQKIRRYLSTDQRIHKDEIAKSKIKVSDRTKTLRQLIDKKKVELEETLRKLEMEHKGITPDIYDSSLTSSKYDRLTITELFTIFIKNKSGVLGERTIQKYNTLNSLLTDFISLKRKSKLVYPNNIDPNFFTEFTKFLTVDKDHAISTVQKYQICFKTFMQFVAKDLKINMKYDTNEFKRVSIKTAGGAKVVLLKEHVSKLIKWKATNTRYGTVRDLFLFSILTGIRFSDLERVNKSFVVNNSLSFTMYKTQTRVNIPLHPRAVKILKSYDYDLGSQCKAMTNFNLDIKTVCRKAGLTDTISQLKIKLNRKKTDETPLCDLVSSHVGRTTFITNCLIAGISPFIVMAYSGHKDIDTLAVYMRLAGDMERDAFTKFETYFKF